MSKTVLLSIKPKYCEFIANGKKTIEVRKTKPELELPFKCYIYCTKSNDGLIKGDISTTVDYVAKNSGKVIGEFVCDKIITVDCDSIAPFNKESGEYIDKETCLDRDTLWKYTNGRCVYGWYISDLKIYDEPKELGEFYKIPSKCHRGIQKDNCDYCFDCQITRPPQSWRYVEEAEQ